MRMQKISYVVLLLFSRARTRRFETTRSTHERSQDADGVSRKHMERFKDAFDEIPLTLIKLLKLYDGGIYFDESKMLSAKEMISTSERSTKMSEEWGKDWIPFAEDVDENLLLIDSKGKVRTWDPESEELEKECLGSSFATYLEKFRNRLCSGHMEYIEEVGVVESCGAPVKKVGGSGVDRASKLAD